MTAIILLIHPNTK